MREVWRNMHWLKAQDSASNTAQSTSVILHSDTAIDNSNTKQEWQMQMESGFDKSDNSISLRGPRRYGRELLKIFNHFVKAARCCLTLEEGECHMDQKIAKTLKWDEEGSGSCNNSYLMYCNFHTFFCLSLSGGYVESSNPKQDGRESAREWERGCVMDWTLSDNCIEAYSIYCLLPICSPPVNTQ